MTLQWGGLQNRSISRKKKVNNSLKCSLGCFSILAYMLAVAAVRACPPHPLFLSSSSSSFSHCAFSTPSLSEGGIILYRHISCFPEDPVKRVILLRSAEPY